MPFIVDQTKSKVHILNRCFVDIGDDAFEETIKVDKTFWAGARVL